MPPPHRFLAPRLRGYVCRACLSKSQVPRRQPPLWLSRNASNDRGPPQSKGVIRQVGLPEPEPEIREFEQTADGTRIEIRDDPLKEIEDEIRDIERQEGKSIEELVGPFDFESFLEDDGEQTSYDPIMGDSMAVVTKRTEELEAMVERINSISDFSTLSTEDRSKLREELLNFVPADKDSLPPATSSTLSTEERSKLQEELLNSVTADEDSVTPSTTISQAALSSPPPSKSADKPWSHAKTSDTIIPVELFAKNGRAPLEALSSVLNRSLATSGGRRLRHPLKYPSKNRPSQKDIWKAYLLCRNAIRSASYVIPEQVWQTLWDTFAKEGADNLDRMAHIKSLGEDMSNANISLSPPQRLLYIESIFIAGDRDIALREWEAAEYLQQDETHFKQYLELGIRMFCQARLANRAMEVAEIFLRDGQEPSDFRILLPMIKAYLRISVQRAWALYIRLRVNLGPQMTMDDYDAITSMFLEANQLDLALGAFKDMMLTGSPSASKQDSTAQYRDAVGLDKLGSVTIQSRELDWENSRTLAELPIQFRNRFFFGSWIKKLIGEGELDAAKKVFDLMQTRQIRPDAKHMNGLIGAWLRQRTEKSRVLAEDMAWKMIQARLDFVKARHTRYNLQAPLQVVSTKGLPDNKSITFIPSATVETFAILIEQYRRRQKPELMSDLFDAFRRARIQPNTSFMNELLLSDTRANHSSWAWDTYYSLTKGNGLQPDVDTYKILWNLMKRALDPVVGSKSDKQPNFTTCRRLFADMVERRPSLIGKKRLPQELYDLIILSFSLALDQAGTAVALRALQRHFGRYPNEETARTVLMQLARYGMEDEFGNKPKRLDLQSPITKERLANVTKILETFKNQRIEVLSQQGIVFDQLRGRARSEESLLLLSDLLRHVARARIAAEERHNYNAAIASMGAADQMGVPDCVPWVAHSDGEI